MSRRIHQEASWGFYSFGGGSGPSEYDDTIWRTMGVERGILLSYVNMSIPYIICLQRLGLSSCHAHWPPKIDVVTEHGMYLKLAVAITRSFRRYPECCLEFTPISPCVPR